MSTDLTAGPLDLIIGYSLRFKIEICFKQSVHQIGVFLYRFWLKKMAPNVRGRGDQVLQFAQKTFKESVSKKLGSYNLFIQIGLIAQGLLQYLSIHHPVTIRSRFGSWLRTMRSDTLPSEMVCAQAMANTYGEFLNDEPICLNFKKFLNKKIDFGQIRYKIPTRSEAA